MVFEVKQVLRMKEGTDETSYVKTSYIQVRGFIEKRSQNKLLVIDVCSKVVTNDNAINNVCAIRS